MASKQKSLQFGTTEPGNDVLYVEIAMTAAGITPGDIISAYTAFNRAFSAVPEIIGTNVIDGGATTGVVSAVPTVNGITFYGTAVTGGGALSGTFQVSATLRGALA